MSFSAADLDGRLAASDTGRPARYVVAFSGGLDSTVLLHALVATGTDVPILAAHVDHGLHEQSSAWEAHCREFAQTLGVDYTSRRAAVALDSGESVEAAAREARYAIFAALLDDGDCLLSAHHENDQAETLLLNLLRGSGLAGLAGIGRSRPMGAGRLLRPLLGVPRADLEAYAAAAGLTWIEDPANRDARYDRNFLRHEILPALAARWPAAVRRLARSAELAGEASDLLDDLAAIDLAAAGSAERLDLGVLAGLSEARQRNLLRHAVRRLGLPAPPGRRLARIVGDFLAARPDARPEVAWPGAVARRYRGRLYIAAEDRPRADLSDARLAPGGAPVPLGEGLGEIGLEASSGPGIAAEIGRRGLVIRWREGGERFRPRGHVHRRRLKRLLQEAGIVPWMRGRIPLIYAGDELVAVADLWIAAEAAAEPGLRVCWHGRPALR